VSEFTHPTGSAYEIGGSVALQASREADPELVAEDSERLGAALPRVLDYLPDGGRALVVEIVPPLAKGDGPLVVAGDRYSVEPLE
jgi:hypothetical protein